jgi:1-acyl-sn-glycerol-3-phosphate acyltransferase
MNAIRTAAFTGYFVVVTFLIAVGASPTLITGGALARGAVKLWARSILWGLRAICGIAFRIEGAENTPRGGAIVAANHQSMWETIALFALLPDAVMVFKRELARVPAYGWWALRTGSIPVDRAAGAKAIRALTKAAKSRIAEGRQIVVFPQGTRVRVGERGPLMPGVAAIYMATGAPCTTVVHDSGRFWRFPGRLTSLKTPGIITVRIQPRIDAGLGRRTFIAELERRFAAIEAAPDAAPSAPPRSEARAGDQTARA